MQFEQECLSLRLLFGAFFYFLTHLLVCFLLQPMGSFLCFKKKSVVFLLRFSQILYTDQKRGGGFASRCGGQPMRTHPLGHSDPGGLFSSLDILHLSCFTLN